VLREYRSAQKRASTYGAGWAKGALAGGGRVYAGWKQIRADSGRMACKAPNLQNLPRDPRYRNCVVAPPGRVLVKADYSQIELRIAARVAGETRMIEAYRAGQDLHTLTARMVLGKEDVSKEERQLAKALNFGLLYGMGARRFRENARAEYGLDLTEAVVHDEIVVECDVDQAGAVAAWLHRAMVDGLQPLIDPVPVEVEVKVARTWTG
jgi:DNA polymerase-1